MVTSKWESKTFLIVEDDEVSLEFIKELFDPYLVKLISVDNGKDAVEICRENSSIDLILMDVQLPVLNGRDAMIQIKKIYPDIPIIAQTAFAMSGDRERYINDGFDAYISKPINVSEMLMLIEKLIF
jgi:two-component system, cell cycle response regulator DivK